MAPVSVWSDDDQVDDFSRADLMTPFSLSLAAERAIENAKRRLDAMDARLLHARSSIDRARQLIPRRQPEPAVVVAPVEEPSVSPGTAPEPPDERKALEVKRLSDDLRRRYSRESRAISETLNLSPPRPPRPSLGELPNLEALDREFRRRSDLFVGELPTTAALDAKWRRRSEGTTVHPLVQTVGRFVSASTPSLSSSSSSSSVATVPPTYEPPSELPFSPRPDAAGPWSLSGLQAPSPGGSSLASGGTPKHSPSSRLPRRSSATPSPTTTTLSSFERVKVASTGRGDLSRRLATVLTKIDEEERRREGLEDGRRRRLEAALDLLEDI